MTEPKGYMKIFEITWSVPADVLNYKILTSLLIGSQINTPAATAITVKSFGRTLYANSSTEYAVCLFPRFWFKVQLEMILLETLLLMTFPSSTVSLMKVNDYNTKLYSEILFPVLVIFCCLLL